MTATLTLGPTLVSPTAPTARELLRPEVDLWIWERSLAPDVRRLAERLRYGRPWSAAGELCDQADADDATALLDRAAPAGLPLGPLATDLAVQARLLAELLDVPAVHVRLEVGQGQPCPLFHVDATRARLICTYAGPGTEWLAPEDADRTQLGVRGRTFAAANAAIATGAPKRIRPGAVAIFKGAAEDPTRAAGLVHRSPSAEAGARVVLIVDALGSGR